MRRVHSILAVAVFLGSGCSPEASSPSGSGGAQGTSGATGSGGAANNGGASGSGGAANTSGAAGSGGAGNIGGASGSGAASGTGGTAGTGGASGAGGRSGSGGEGMAGAAGTGGRAIAGSGGRGGGAGATGGGGSGGGSGSAGAGGGMQSGGCGKTRTLQNGTINITFGGASRKYILRVPDNYDNNHAYRLVFAYAESGSSAMSVVTRNYFTLATLDTNKTTIFAAPDAANGAGSWSKSDVELTDAILAQLEGDLCIDKTRIFATGFSFGGAMSLALACTRADVFRGVAFFSGADLTGSCTGTLTKPIAYYASQASQDSTGTPMPSSGRVKQAEFAAVNGCTPEPSATTFPAAGQPHKCTIYKNCSAGHPTVYCVFDGAHGWEPRDPGQSTSWNAPEAWKFITQF
jgi:poly(3-hydroxybutyrate) depolymerase